MCAHDHAQVSSGWMVFMEDGFNNGSMEGFQYYNSILVVFKILK